MQRPDMIFADSRKIRPPENSPGKFALHRVFQIFHLKKLVENRKIRPHLRLNKTGSFQKLRIKILFSDMQKRHFAEFANHNMHKYIEEEFRGVMLPL